jgi:actin-like ATPase involved in cell morphogenesis
MSYSLGIDVGTTYTAAATGEGGRVEVLQLGTRSATMPSVVFLRGDGAMLSGETAERRAAAEPANAAREFKRRLGDPTPVIVGGVPYGAEALMAALLREVLARAKQERGAEPEAVAITHPASWSAYKLDLLREAARQAGIERALFVSEPEAAAVHYASQERIEPGTVLAVYDFGGGTFDAAVVRKTAAGFEPLGTPDGLERLGGVDFDEAVLAHVRESVEVDLASLGLGRAEAARLRAECQLAKEALSADTDVSIPVRVSGVDTEVRLTRAEFEDAIRPRLDDTLRSLERAVRSAGLTMGGVDRVLLIGGSSRIPLVKETVAAATGRPAVTDAHPKHAIALGAAMLAREHVGAPPAPPAAVVPPAAVAIPAVTPIPAPPPRTRHEAPAEAPRPPARNEARPPGEAQVAAPLRPTPSAPAAAAGATTSKRGWRPGRVAIAAAGVAVTVAVAAVAAVVALSGGGGGEVSAADLAGSTAIIEDVAIQGDDYVVSFAANGFEPSSKGGRLRFFWDSTPVSQISGTGSGPWEDWTSTRPFDRFSPSSVPSAASQICVVVVDSKGTLVAQSGSCFAVR